MAPNTLKHKLQSILQTLESERSQRSVIVLFGVGSYGDVLQITPLLSSLKQKFHDKSLVLIHNDPTGKMLLNADPRITHYLQLNAEDHRLLKKLLTEKHYDLMVECRYVITYTLPPHSRLSAKEKKFIHRAKRLQENWLGFLDRFPFNNDLLWRHAVSHGFNMFSLMAHTSGFGKANFENLHLATSLPARDDIPHRLPEAYVAVSNSAGWLNIQSNLWTKCLPHSKMNALLAGLKEAGIPNVLLGTTNDPGFYSVDIDLRGKTTLLQVASLVKNAALVLAPEGGLVNLARAVRTKSVVFFGSTPRAFFGFAANINIEPSVCGGCWWTTRTYLGQCPLLEPIPPCTNSIPLDALIHSVKEHFHGCPVPA